MPVAHLDRRRSLGRALIAANVTDIGVRSRVSLLALAERSLHKSYDVLWAYDRTEEQSDDQAVDGCSVRIQENPNGARSGASQTVVCFLDYQYS